MPEDLKLSQIGSSQLPPPFRGLHSPGVRNNCQIIFVCYFPEIVYSGRIWRKVPESDARSMVDVNASFVGSNTSSSLAKVHTPILRRSRNRADKLKLT